MPPAVAWAVLTLVFVDEVLAVVALADVGTHLGGAGVAVVLAGAAVGLWWCFASPKAPWGGTVTRPVVKVLVFGTACAGLWWAGHPVASVALLGFSVVVNALAMTRGVTSVLSAG